MTVPNTFSLDSIVDVTVEISALAAPRAVFNELLILGTSDVISTSDRAVLYEDTDAMLDDGFTSTDPEYIAALIYFAQSPAPRRLWVGRQDVSVSPPESCLDAMIECRTVSFDWYYCVALAATKDDHEEIALWAESAVPATIYGYTTSDADILGGATSPPNVFQALHALNYSRTIGSIRQLRVRNIPITSMPSLPSLDMPVGRLPGWLALHSL
jgi:hypothetical protein